MPLGLSSVSTINMTHLNTAKHRRNEHVCRRVQFFRLEALGRHARRRERWEGKANFMAVRAYTRAVSPRLADCALTHLKRVPIDAHAAHLQHLAYEDALRAAGASVVRLPPLPEHPDGVFVEDTALLLGGHAVITRPGASSRANEVISTAAALAPDFEVHHIDAGHLDGGDVLRIGRTLYVGLSSRTNPEGIAELGKIAGKLGFEVVSAQLRACLHLKTAATVAGRDADGRRVLIYSPRAVDAGQFADVDPVAIAEDEPDAANVLSVARRVIMPAGSPKTAAQLRRRGFVVEELDVSELQKAEAGVTCMSLISDEAAH
jgi:dimethylargininase